MARTKPRRRSGIWKSITRRFHSGIFTGAFCVAILDVLRFTSPQDPLAALRQHPDFRCRSYRRIKRIPGKFQAYGQVHWFQHRRSEMKICIESKKQEPWLADYRISFYADDCTGLVAGLLLSVLELMPRLQLTFCECALDFSPVSQVDRVYVLARTVFGKSRRDLTSTNRNADWWGSRRGAKRIVSYFKSSICGHRVEFKLRARFLRHYGVHDVLDLPKLAKVLPRHHILFVRLDESRLQKRLRTTGLSAARMAVILGTVRQKQCDLFAVLSFLRKVVGLTNVRRLVVPLATNRLVRQAFEQFAAHWPKASTPLGGNK
jgi:hypothetical protein